jgi:HSP20 family protein
MPVQRRLRSKNEEYLGEIGRERHELKRRLVMNRQNAKRTVLAVAVLALVGTVGAQTYYTHELAERVTAQETAQRSEGTATPDVVLRDHWAAMHADIMRMQAQMDKLFNSSFDDFHAVGLGGQQVKAPVTLEEQGNNYVVRADIPGAKEGDINVNLDGRLLSISNRSQGGEKQTADNGQVVRQESYARSFQQAFTLPGPVNASGMQTHLQDGVLTVTIPKITS